MELRNLAGNGEAEASRFQAELLERVARLEQTNDSAPEPIDPSAIEQLRELGYIQ